TLSPYLFSERAIALRPSHSSCSAREAFVEQLRSLETGRNAAEHRPSTRRGGTMRGKTRVLFLSTHNAARSQMAEAYLRAMGGSLRGRQCGNSPLTRPSFGHSGHARERPRYLGPYGQARQAVLGRGVALCDSGV